MDKVKIGFPIEYEDENNIVRNGIFLREPEIKELEKRLKEINKIIDLKQQVKKQQQVIDKAIEYLTSYSSIHTIQFGTENDSLNDIELNKTLDEKTLNKMTNRYLKVHDKLLEIL